MFYNSQTDIDMQNIKVIVSKVEVKPCTWGIINNKPAKFARTHHMEKGVCLYVEGLDESGKEVHFWTPQAIISECKGMLHYEKLTKNTGNFFKEVKGEMVGHNSPFEGDTIMPIVIECKDKVEPSISVGQTIEISFKEDEQKFGQRRLKTVRLKYYF